MIMKEKRIFIDVYDIQKDVLKCRNDVADLYSTSCRGRSVSRRCFGACKPPGVSFQRRCKGPPISQRVCVYAFGPCEGPNLRWRKRGREHCGRDSDVGPGGILPTVLRRRPGLLRAGPNPPVDCLQMSFRRNCGPSGIRTPTRSAGPPQNPRSGRRKIRQWLS